MNKNSNNVAYTEREKRIRKHWLISFFIFNGIYCVLQLIMFYSGRVAINSTFFAIFFMVVLISYVDYKFAYKKNGTGWLFFRIITLPFCVYLSYNAILYKFVDIPKDIYFWINCLFLYTVNVAKVNKHSLPMKNLFHKSSLERISRT